MANPSRTALLALAVMLCAGCVTVDGTLKADGSGTLEVTYRIPPNTTEAAERARFTSPHVTVKSITMQPDRATVKVAFDDVTKLATAEGFKALDVTRTRTGDEEALRVIVTNRTPVPQVRDEGRAGPHITLQLPGKVIEANRQAEVSGERVVWRISFADYVRNPTTDLVVRYALASSPPTTSSR
jgi:hypothetical protein